MIIGIDVDGVLVDIGKYQLETGIPYFSKKYEMKVKNPKAYDVVDIFGCSREQREKYWAKYIWKYCLGLPMREGAAKTAEKLRKMGHQIYVITGRAHTTEKGISGKLFRWMLEYWLKKNKFEYDRIFYVSEKNSASDKYEVCVRKKVDVLVDDKSENLVALKDTIKVFCYQAPWNEDIRAVDEYRISSFDELLKYMN